MTEFIASYDGEALVLGIVFALALSLLIRVRAVVVALSLALAGSVLGDAACSGRPRCSPRSGDGPPRDPRRFWVLAGLGLRVHGRARQGELCAPSAPHTTQAGRSLLSHDESLWDEPEFIARADAAQDHALESALSEVPEDRIDG